MYAAPPDPISPLLLSDRLITMAEQAGQAGYRDAARRLLALACQMLNNPPLPQHQSNVVPRRYRREY